MKKPVLHLICNAHLDPVWQWRWEEGAAAAISTFDVAARLLQEFPDFVFNHNEAILYRWVEEYNPSLFEEIRRLVENGRWCITGGWDLQPDVNLPGTESIIRHIAEGREYFHQRFNVRPRVAYNFDSFGHSGGLPEILSRAGFELYVHMRPGENDLPLPSDLYRWCGVSGSEIGVYRIPLTGYNTYHGGTVKRITEGVETALRLDRDTPVFWGLGDHGGGATRNELEQIRDLIHQERRVDIVHSSLERFLDAIRPSLASAPVVHGDLQRVFTGCYTSMSRIKRRMQRNLGELVQTEALCAAAWMMHGAEYPDALLRDAWRDHLFNDFHDILAGSSIEAAELDALDLYGRSSETQRRLRLGAAAVFSGGSRNAVEIPIVVLNANPAARQVPVEVEYMIDDVPKFEGKYHVRLFTADDVELPVQEEVPDALFFRDIWRRKISFQALLPHVGSAHYRLEVHEGPVQRKSMPSIVHHSINPETGLLATLDAGNGREILAGEAPEALVIEDPGDSWGTEEWSYRNVTGHFTPVRGTLCTVEDGPVRTITESVSEYSRSRIVFRTISYSGSPFLEFRLRIHWNEEHSRLKLSIPTVLQAGSALCEVPGGAILRPADGQEHVHGRWLILDGSAAGRSTALAIINSGQNGFDMLDGEIRISILRSAAYCHVRSLPRVNPPQWPFMDQGVHDVRLLLLAGDPDRVRSSVVGLADWLSAPPFALAHFPVGEGRSAMQDLLSVDAANVRMVACKRSADGSGLVLRLQEGLGRPTRARLQLNATDCTADLSFLPFEIKTLRFERDGTWREVTMIEEE
jgi:alpha-mannosidase